MKICGYAETRKVFIDGRELLPDRSQKEYYHSPDGFSWGYSGSGPAQLALAILLELTDKDTAVKSYQQFKSDVITGLNMTKDFILDASVVQDFLQGNTEIKPPVIYCICGSTKFADLHAIMKWELEKDGKAICIMINYLPEWFAKEKGWKGHHHFGEQAGRKEILDELHLRKIDLADGVFVINKDGYIGESTRNEIEYAKKHNKPISYLEEIK